MIKFLSLILILLSLVSCEEEIASYDNLNAAERLAIQTRSRDKCLTDSLSGFTNFKTTSNIEMAKFVRTDFWKLTIPGTTTADYLYVWKVSGSTVYFLYQQKQGTTTYHQFIKMTPTFNGEMSDDLRIQKCATKTPAITQSSTTFTIKYLDALSTEGSTKYRTDTTYSGVDDHPTFFGLFAQKLFKEKLNTDGAVVSSEDLTYSVAYQGRSTQLFNTFSEYSDKKYCVYKYTNSTPKTFIFPYTLSCTETLATNPNTFGDAAMDFTSTNL